MGILGIAIMIIATFIYQPYNKDLATGSNQRYGLSFFTWFLGLIITGLWLSKFEKNFRKKVSMLFAILGQVLLWFSIHLTLQMQSTKETYSLAAAAIFCWCIALLFAKIKRIGRYRSVERRNFNFAIQSKILDKQKNRCAKCKTDLTSKIVQFDHMDGDRSNNDESNCQALCSNCHSEKSRSR